MHIEANPHLSNPLSSSSSFLIIAAKPLLITEVICCYKRDVFGTAFNYFCFWKTAIPFFSGLLWYYPAKFALETKLHLVITR